jgi:hypothetical protein
LQYVEDYEKLLPWNLSKDYASVPIKQEKTILLRTLSELLVVPRGRRPYACIDISYTETGVSYRCLLGATDRLRKEIICNLNMYADRKSDKDIVPMKLLNKGN